MRKVLSVLVVVCLVLSLLTEAVAPVPAARADTYGDYTYTVSGGNATITGYTGLGGVVVLPSMLGGCPVTTIGDGAFNNTQGHLLTSVTIPNSVTRVGNTAFYGCTALTGLVIPNSVTSTGNSVFQGCTALTSLTIGSGLTTIGYAVFSGCTALTSLTIPSTVTSVSTMAFLGCAGLTSVSIGSGLTSIQYAVFQGCTALTSLTIPSTVTSVSTMAFFGCKALTTALFLGNAPLGATDMFKGCGSGFTVQYVSGTTGWTNPWYGYPASVSSGAMYTLTTTASPPAGGSIGWSPVAASYTPGTVLTLTATPAAGYTFTSWSGNVTGTANPETITMDGNKAVTATFTMVPTYTLTPSAGTGGTMTPNTAQAVLQGGSATFSIAANTGYRIADVTVDGVPQGNIFSYTFTNVTSNHTISARFEQEERKTVIVLQIGNSVFTVNGSSKTLDSPPVIKNSRTLVPIRAVIEALGGTVGWDGTARKVTVTLGATSLNLWIGKSVATVNGTNTAIDATNAKVVPEIINSRTMLPLRFVSENLGCSVLWEDATKTITITYRS